MDFYRLLRKSRFLIRVLEKREAEEENGWVKSEEEEEASLGVRDRGERVEGTFMLWERERQQGSWTDCVSELACFG